MFVHGNELCVYTAADGGKQIRSGQMTFSFVIDLSEVSSEVAECIVVNRRTKEFRLTNEAAGLAEDVRQKIWAPIKMRRESVA